MKTKTIDLKGKQYAQVKDRLQEFRSANPNGLIETTPTIQPDGQILFKARILKDKGDATSGEASGHALGKNTGDKAFEKLETIAVGRALALLGYASDGEIASSEEMEDFEAYRKTKREEVILAATEKLEECKSLDELKTAWAALPVEAKTDLAALKETMKVKLSAPVLVVAPKPKAKKVEPKIEEPVTEQLV